MKICSTPLMRANAIKHVRPKKIAVAFVGKGWLEHLGGVLPSEIVLSPTLGSNPFAIEELMTAVGEKNVHFLDNLHSKLYIGEDQAFLGSQNLSDNGFSQNGNNEIGVLLSHENSLKELNAIFEEYKKAAVNAYPTPERKKKQLQVLFEKWQSAACHKLTFEESEPSEPESIKNYTSQLNRIHVVWWIDVESGKLDPDTVKTAMPQLINHSEDELEDYFTQEYEMLEEDDIHPGDWILGWEATKKLMPSTRKCGEYNITWAYVHHVIPHGYTGTAYTKLAAQDPNLSNPPFPFELTPKTRKAIVAALQSGKFPQLLCTYSNPWKLKPADMVVKPFIDEVKLLV